MRRLLRTLVCLGVVAGLAGGGWVWWRHATGPEYRLRAGREALRRGDFQAAERYATLLTADGQADHAALLRGESLFQRQNYAGALAEFNRIRDRGELRLDAALLTGRCLLELHELRQAEHAFLFVLNARPEEVDAHRGLAAVYHDQGAQMRAVRHLEEWARLDPHDGRPYRQMGFIYRGLELLPDAIASYRQALERRLTDRVVIEVRMELADCLLRQAAWAEALETLDGGEPVPPYPMAESVRIDSLWGLGRAVEARAEADRAAAAFPEEPAVLRLRAKIHLADKQPSQAVPLLRRALDLDRHDRDARFRLAQAYDALGQKADADEQRRRLRQTEDLLKELKQRADEAEQNPWDPAPRRRLAAIYKELDNPEMAQAMERAAQEARPAP